MEAGSGVVVDLAKACTHCLERKPFNEFYKDKRTFDGMDQRCKACVREYQNAWARKNPKSYLAWKEKRSKRLAHERRVKRIEAGIPLLEPRTTQEGRLCSTCRVRKPQADFSPNKAHYDGLYPVCKPCAAAAAREWGKKNPEKKAKSRRKMNLKKYGLTVETFEALSASQGNKCAICRDQLTIGRKGACVDHDHGTGDVRGILCVKCNAGLGQFRDTTEFLRAAIEYLQRARGEI